METYKCISPLGVPLLNEKGEMTGKYKEVLKGSIWEYAHDYSGNSEARLYLKDGNSDYDYIDITIEDLKAHFRRIA